MKIYYICIIYLLSLVYCSSIGPIENFRLNPTKSSKFERLRGLKSLVFDGADNEKLPMENKLSLSINYDLALFLEGVFTCYVGLNALVESHSNAKTRRLIRFQNLFVMLIFRVVNVYMDFNHLRLDLNGNPTFNTTSLPTLLSNATSNHRESQSLAYTLHSQLFQYSSWPIIIQNIPFIIRWLSLYILSTIPYDNPSYSKYKDTINRLLFSHRESDTHPNTTIHADLASENVDSDNTTKKTITLDDVNLDDIFFSISVIVQLALLVNQAFSSFGLSSNQVNDSFSGMKRFLTITIVPYIFFLWQYFSSVLHDPAFKRFRHLIDSTTVRDHITSLITILTSSFEGFNAKPKPRKKKLKRNKLTSKKRSSAN